MSRLSENWISEGCIDFEYKKYVLLGYLKSVNAQFREVKLYPPLTDLIYHYEKLKNFDQNRNQLKLAFPKEVKGIDAEKMQLTYKNMMQDDEVMKELASIVDYALPKIKSQIEEGKTIYDFLERNMKIEPIGITPIYQREGYAFLSLEKSRDIYIYRYTINIFQNSMDNFRGIALRFLQMTKVSLVNTFEKIKMDLVKKFVDLPNPPAWRIHSQQQVPVNESLVPISKRLLLQAIE